MHIKNKSFLQDRNNRIILVLIILTIVAIVLFLMYGITSKNFSFNFPRRLKKVFAMAIVGCSIGYSTVIFQTVTENRILTPSVMGLDQLYMFIQTVVVFAFGQKSLTLMNDNTEYFISIILMVFASWVIYKLIFNDEAKNIYFLVLIGMVFGRFFGGISSFMQMIIDPNDFSILQGKMFASFNLINTELLFSSTIIICATILISAIDINKYDVLNLGRDTAIGLGVSHGKLVKKSLMIVSILVSVSTALIGPITFLGILVVNVTKEALKTYKHKYLIAGASLISVFSMVFGQFIVERILKFDTTLGVILNFIGGIYFIYVLLKEKS